MSLWVCINVCISRFERQGGEYYKKTKQRKSLKTTIIKNKGLLLLEWSDNMRQL
jgi:hypothetical protein